MLESPKPKGDELGRLFRIFAMCIAVLVSGAHLSFAQSPMPAPFPGIKTQIIKKITVEGAQRIDPGTVVSYMVIKEGDVFDPERINRSLKSLYATGLFADVSIERQDTTLLVIVTENPVINRVAFEGNQKVESDVLETEVTLRPRVIFTRTKVQKDVKRLLAVYRLNGRFAASIEPKVIQLPQNRIDLVFEINEGKATKIQKIRFIGNQRFKDSRLREIVRTKETRWWRFLSSDDTYDPDRLTLDRELLRRFYLTKGYADFRVISAIAELSPDRSNFFITFTLEEGSRYRFGDVNLAVRLRGVDEKKLSDEVDIKPSDWYDNSDIEKTIRHLTTVINKSGQPFVNVRPRINRNREEKKINITFEVNEGPRTFVERIDISGNVRTTDQVIRREFRLVEGDAFNVTKLRRSRQRIQNLDYFKKVTVRRTPGSAPDKTILKADVEEKPTGTLLIGAGFSTTSGALIDLGVEEKNFLGRGQKIKVSATVAEKRNEVDFSFTEPWFLNRAMTAGLDVFRTSEDLQDESSFDRRATGGALRLGYPITERVGQLWKYLFNKTKIRDIDEDASPFIQSEAGSRIISQISHTLAYDNRNSKIAPTKGMILRTVNDFAGVGGPTKFLRIRVNGAKYIPITEDWVLSLRGGGGYIVGLFGEDVGLLDRFFVGGESIRGFESSGIGPRDRNTRDALGGEWKYNGTVEVSFPVGLPASFGVKGRMFSDFGSVADTTPSDPDIFDSSSIRASVGAGITWTSPFGPIGVDLSYPVVKEDLDRTEFVRLNFGTRF